MAQQAPSRREDIVAAAARMFATRGYAETGVDDIGEAVGITGPALYRHFANKQALVDAVVLDGMKSLVAQAEEIVDNRALSVEQMLDQLIEMRIDFALGPHRHSFAIRHNASVYLSTEALHQIAAFEVHYRDEWMRVLTQLKPEAPTSQLNVSYFGAHMLIGYTVLHEPGLPPEILKPQLFRVAKAALLA
jgi:AcrR family transcriptional regulator